MTKLEKVVTREAKQGLRGIPFVVSLHPHGFVELRLKGHRAEHYRLSFESIWTEGARRAADELRRERLIERRRTG